MYNMYKASVSPGSVQQIMPYLQQPPLLRQSSHLNHDSGYSAASFKHLARISQKTPMCMAVTPTTIVSTRQRNSGSGLVLVINQLLQQKISISACWPLLLSCLRHVPSKCQALSDLHDITSSNTQSIWWKPHI
jgi:hypothetical protein